MTAAQRAKYFWEWGRARAWYISHGVRASVVDQRRHALHAQALGKDKSSKELSNADLDKVLAAFKAVYDGGNLNAQIRQAEQPEMRRNRLRSAAVEIAMGFVDARLPEFREPNALRYIDGMCKRMSFPGLHDCDERQLGAIKGALERTARVRGKLMSARDEADRLAEADKNPF